MSDIAQLNLKQPEQIEWNKFNKSGYQAPPVAEDASGQRIVYSGVLPKEFAFDADDEGNLVVIADPVTITGPTAKDAQLRFVRQSTRMFTTTDKKTGELKSLNVNSLGKMLRAAGSKATPQTNDQYVMATKQVASKSVQFVIDWEAYNKDTGESIKGFRSFPLDPAYPGTRKTILHAGDVYNVIDKKGNVIDQATVKSEVIFANAKLRSFVEPNKVA